MYNEQLSKNAHVIEHRLYAQSKSLESSVIVIGKKHPRSKLLTHAMRISELAKDSIGRNLRVVGKHVLGYDGKTRDWTQILGFAGSVQRSTPRWIFPQYVKRLEVELGIIE
ncbi:MAG: hypothetical protein QMD13_03780 [Candidatus Bathyarchaeia archaeon]|nr:hypothetical protein [Candidatus Bathyarchaeia archaeon]